MHNLFLGELRHHCINVWGIDVKDKSAFATRARPHTPEEQKKWLDRVTDALRKRSIPAVTQAWKGYVVTIAQLNGITPASKLTKREYAKALIEWLLIPPVLAEDTNDFHLAKGPYDISKYRVLTADVLSQLRHDIEHTFLPSWLERPPKNFGSPAHGKLKADHWRTVCTIHMVITLVRLWGREAAPERKRLLLENFCHLVIAHELVPNHHLSLHLAACLLLFGPVHGWWAFPFERFNGILERLSTNNQTNQIPLTFMHTFTAGAELRWTVATMDWPDSEDFKDVLKAFRSTYGDMAQGTTVLTSVSPSGCPHISPLAQFVSKVNHGNVVYGTCAHNIRNSFICFRDTSSAEAFLIVDWYEPLTSSDLPKDPYRRFPLLETKLYYNRFQACKSVIPVSDVETHFAALAYDSSDIGADCIVVHSLDRVCATYIDISSS
ncbi:hypothetical protein PYCCODRAFT_1444830 [Trametes coccinea BRFM310]|uniref:Uncharacterized protein n=1 Tax=Trametes coccinea (strain BRFM310) TaxID=1353009 RepID=A0A1Y2INP5_TRAC3|nr:hypothetical protein PYCCODRAFT_1444830 [Trametes coccinea BRFM310]